MSSKCSFNKVVCDNLDSKGDHITLNKNLKTFGNTNTVTSYDQLTLASIDDWSTNGKDNQNRYIRMVYDTVLYPSSFSSFRPFQNNMTYRQPLGTLTFGKKKDISIRAVSHYDSFIKSNDGINWLSLGNVDGLLTQTGSGQNNIAITGYYDGAKYFLMKTDVSSPYTDRFYYSYNGIRYNLLSVPGLSGSTDRVYSIGYNGSIYCLGTKGNITHNLLYSYDGFNWLTSIGLNPGSGGVTDIIFIGTMWLAGLYNQVGSAPILYSYDGINWTNSNVTLNGSMDNIGGAISDWDTSGRDSIVWNGHICVAVGENTISTIGTIMYSYDGLAWTVATLSPAPGLNSFFGFVDYNGKYWLAGGEDISKAPRKTILYRSDDGIYWTEVSNATNLLDGIITTGKWFKDKWIIGGVDNTNVGSDENEIVYSYDGVNWNYIDYPTTNAVRFLFDDSTSINRIDYPPNRTFVCGAGDKIIFSDTNGRGNWISANTTASLGTVFCVRRGKNILLATSDGTDKLAYSLDWGYNWIGLGEQIFDNTCFSLWYDNNMWVGVGSDNNTIGYSYDGVTWFPASGDTFDVVGWDVMYSDGIWVAVGQDSVVGIRYSVDGISWNLPDTNPFNSGRTFYTLTKTKNYWIACGWLVNIYGISADGRNWIKKTFTDFPSPPSLSGILTGYDKNTGQIVASIRQSGSQAYYSFDGISWDPSGPNSDNGNQRPVYNGEYWILPRSINPEISISTNGIDWVTQDVNLGGSANSVSTTNPNIPYVHIQHPTLALGENSYGSSMAISYDGLKWEILPHTIFTRANRALWNGIMWVAVGEGVNTLAYSYNGVSWIGLGINIFDVAGYDLLWDGTNWYAVGSGTDNTIAYSSDGINWSGIGKPVSTTSLRGIAWNRSIYVVTGTDGSNTLFYSTNLIDISTWSVASGDHITTLGYSVRYFGPDARFVAVGTGTDIATHSSDGITWTKFIMSGSALPPDNGFRDIAYNREKAYLVGNDTGPGSSIGWIGIGVTSVTMIPSISITNVKGICWTGNRFVTVGDTSGFVHSGYDHFFGEYTWYDTPETSNIFDVSVNSVVGNSSLGPIVVESALHMKKNEVLMMNNKLLFRD